MWTHRARGLRVAELPAGVGVEGGGGRQRRGVVVVVS